MAYLQLGDFKQRAFAYAAGGWLVFGLALTLVFRNSLNHAIWFLVFWTISILNIAVLAKFSQSLMFTLATNGQKFRMPVLWAALKIISFGIVGGLIYWMSAVSPSAIGAAALGLATLFLVPLVGGLVAERKHV